MVTCIVLKIFLLRAQSNSGHAAKPSYYGCALTFDRNSYMLWTSTSKVVVCIGRACIYSFFPHCGILRLALILQICGLLYLYTSPCGWEGQSWGQIIHCIVDRYFEHLPFESFYPCCLLSVWLVAFTFYKWLKNKKKRKKRAGFVFIAYDCSSLQNVLIDEVIEPGRRVTVAMGSNRNLDTGNQLDLI